MAWSDYTAEQRQGSEYGGVQPTVNTVQPKPAEALSGGEILRLGYLTGDEQDTSSIEDRRQFYGLRPADGARPNWVENTGLETEAQLQDLGERDE